MRTKSKRMKGGIARMMVWAMLLELIAGPARAIVKQIPVDFDLTNVLVAESAQVDTNNTFLVNWRSGSIESQVGNMTFQYFTGSGRPYPLRSTVLDHTGNDQGDLWSDDAIQFVGTHPNSLGSGVNNVLIYTANVDGGTTDPLNSVALRGGVIGGFGAGQTSPYRVSELPLLWKAVGSADLMAVHGVNALTGVPAVPASGAGNPLWMPSEIATTSGGQCPTGPNEGPYQVGAIRSNNGFCDFSTHYFEDTQNNIHGVGGAGQYANSWYTSYTVGSSSYTAAFSYATIVGPFGANSTEAGQGNLPLEPLDVGQSSSISGAQRAYFVLGLTARSALLTHYGTTINVDLLSM